MARELQALDLTAEAFARYGTVIEAAGDPNFMINAGRCGRYHDLARPQVLDEEGAVSISIGRSDAVTLPMSVDLLERHPLGSQAFVPLGEARMVVVVAPDAVGAPGQPVAFVSRAGQGVQYHAGTWHGVLAPLDEAADFLIVDRVGEGSNLDEVYLDLPFTVRR
jgi:ureidoglycolate lyase